MSNKLKSKPKERFESNSLEVHTSMLLLHNDNHNLFDFVVETLMIVCDHDALQAEQCAFIAHHKGKCDVKMGTFELLKPLKDELIRRGLNATISNI
jgi:ATP-dependent Clp protease adaptor protein ClpS